RGDSTAQGRAGEGQRRAGTDQTTPNGADKAIAAKRSVAPRLEQLHHGFPGFKTDFTDLLRARSRLDAQRARTIFLCERPREACRAGPDWRARHQEHHPGSWSAAAYALRKIREIGFQIREIR